jgi:hypothetical protein
MATSGPLSMDHSRVLPHPLPLGRGQCGLRGQPGSQSPALPASCPALPSCVPPTPALLGGLCLALVNTLGLTPCDTPLS